MAMKPEFKMIVALCQGGGIGQDGQLPWPKLERDMRFFAEVTRSTKFPYNSAVVMGRKTWESIPSYARPLKYRDNFVISSSYYDHDHDDAGPESGVTFIRHLSEIQKYTMKYETVWFIGGASIYEQVLSPQLSPVFPIDEIYITIVDEKYEYDTAFPLTYQYQTVEEWESLRNNPMNRAIWCWTSAAEVPPYISFFNEDTSAQVLYKVMDVNRDFIASITRANDLVGIRERRLPDTRFILARSAAHHGV